MREKGDGEDTRWGRPTREGARRLFGGRRSDDNGSWGTTHLHLEASAAGGEADFADGRPVGPDASDGKGAKAAEKSRCGSARKGRDALTVGALAEEVEVRSEAANTQAEQAPNATRRQRVEHVKGEESEGAQQEGCEAEEARQVCGRGKAASKTVVGLVSPRGTSGGGGDEDEAAADPISHQGHRRAGGGSGNPACRGADACSPAEPVRDPIVARGLRRSAAPAESTGRPS